MPAAFHPGERAIQRLLDGTGAADRVGASVRSQVPEVATKFLHERTMALISAVDGDGRPWVSPLCGPQGFCSVLDDRNIEVRAQPAADDPLAAAFETPADFGLIAMDLRRRRRMRVNGTAVRDGDRLVLSTSQVYANCPKHIRPRERIDRSPPPAGPAAVTTELTPRHRELINQADTFFIGSHAEPFGADCSHRGGDPGFVAVTGTTGLRFTDLAGNSMYQTLGNLHLASRCALLFLNWVSGDCLQLSGNSAVRFADSGADVRFAVERVIHTPRRVPYSWRPLAAR